MFLCDVIVCTEGNEEEAWERTSDSRGNSRLIFNVYYDTTVYVGGNNPGTASLTLAFLDTPKQRWSWDRSEFIQE